MANEFKNVEKNLRIIILAIRFAGVLIFSFGIALMFNFAEIAGKIDVGEGGTNKIIGMVLCIMGIVEFILTPRVLESVLYKNKR